MNHKLRYSIVLGAALAVVAGAGTAAALFATQTGTTHEDSLVASLQTQVAQATDPTIRDSLQEKLRIAEESQRQEAAAAAQTVDPTAATQKIEGLDAEATRLAATPTITLPHLPAGDGYLVDGSVPQLSASVFLSNNDWVLETEPGEREVVWAGVSSQDRKQGELVVISESDTKGFHVEGFYPTPSAHGPVRITTVTGKVLSLRADDGAEFTFDFPSRSFK